jgi:glycosyltransferase involved in cell wall biosynthesis
LINFVSNLPADLRTGGFSGINAAAFAALRTLEPVEYIGPISPPFVLWQKAWSKLLRRMGAPGAFSFFSERRLTFIAREVAARCRAEARLDFFQGFTPWVLTRPERPYVAFSDCTFRDYVDFYHRREQFRRDDLSRIEAAEASWLKHARRVVFTNEWAAKRAADQYRLDSDRIGVAGIYCDTELPERDAYGGGKDFVFVATNFEAKGGPVLLAAFRELRRVHPEASLTIVGDRPSNLGAEPGVSFAGFLRKEVPAEHERYRQLLGHARALVHPTKSDIGPLVLVEAGYFGCPAVSTRRFAIPDLIDHGKTGLLLEDPTRVDELVDAMCRMLDDEDAYQHMRKAAWTTARTAHSKSRFEKALLSFVR